MKKEQLALHGGSPVRSSYLPYGKQWIDQDDIDAVTNILKSDWLTTGPAIAQFENAVARETGAAYAVAFSNGTAALHGACYAAGIGESDEVITSPLTFAASANCILYTGGTPVFADIDEKTYNLSPSSILPLLTEQTKAMITVDFTGQPADYQEILKIARDHGLTLIGDAAHALGAAYKGRSVGSICDMTMFSFHPVKHITTGEGGMITTDDPRLYKKLLEFRTHGIVRDNHHSEKRPWYYEMKQLGYNYRITDIQAALGLSQLTKLKKFIDKRREYAQKYSDAFDQTEGIIPPYQHPSSQSSWHLYILRLDLQKLTADRDEIFRALKAENIGVNVHYIPVYLHPYYQQLGYQPGLCPVAEEVYSSIITLPLFPEMSDQDADDVIAAVKKAVSYYRK